MGIQTYILMETLPYDGIHHIDMHMKLLDEETILMAEYPSEWLTVHKLKQICSMYLATTTLPLVQLTKW